MNGPQCYVIRTLPVLLNFVPQFHERHIYIVITKPILYASCIENFVKFLQTGATVYVLMYDVL
jgi:hypothetical protein